jgi:hypothetical protein
MELIEEVTIHIDTKKVLDEIFKEEPGVFIEWTREHSDEIIKYKNWLTEHINNFLDEMNKLMVKEK